MAGRTSAGGFAGGRSAPRITHAGNARKVPAAAASRECRRAAGDRALPAADACGGNSIAKTRALQLPRKRDNQTNAGCTERVPERNGAAVDIELRLIDAELTHAGEHLCAERFVDLDAIDLRELETRG